MYTFLYLGELLNVFRLFDQGEKFMATQKRGQAKMQYYFEALYADHCKAYSVVFLGV